MTPGKSTVKTTKSISESAVNSTKPGSDYRFRLVSPFSPAGSQPEAIRKLVLGLKEKQRFQTLLGVTGSGKTYTMANVIARHQKPAIVMAHNKTLAAQLYAELKEFFPENRVEYFVSYYDYYQPESYIPSKDQYIEKDSDINPKLEQHRLSATASLLSRPDTIVVASVSCIYNVGNPENYRNLGFDISKGQVIGRRDLMRKLVDILFERNDINLGPGKFRVKGDIIDLVPSYQDNIIRIELLGDTVEKIRELHKTTGDAIDEFSYFHVYPAKHFVTTEDELGKGILSIKKELEEALPKLEMMEAHRLRQRTMYDLDMIGETGSCKGIENYSRHFDGRKPGDRPFCLLDYFPEDFLMIIDESHQMLPQVRGMYNGDYSRKKTLVDYGFRLPSALDNRPLKFPEFEQFMKKVIFVSATPADYELSHSAQVVEQLIRPTGLVDPVVVVRPTKGQIDDLKSEVLAAISRGDRAFVTTLTKKLAEELSEYLSSQKIKTRYLHSEIDTLERTEIIRELRLGKFDVLVGINLLREGLDVPEVGFLAILDADKEGFLRDARSLIQIIGRAARNINSTVVLYADNMTDSMKKAIEETNRRRKIQVEFNRKHGITPLTIIKPVRERTIDIKDIKHIPSSDIPNLIIELEAEMNLSAERLEFERAIQLRDKIRKLREKARPQPEAKADPQLEKKANPQPDAKARPKPKKPKKKVIVKN